MRLLFDLSGVQFRFARCAVILLFVAAMACGNMGCDMHMSPEEIQRRNRAAFAEDEKPEEIRNRPGQNDVGRDTEDGGGFLEDTRRREARERLEQRNKLERDDGDPPRQTSGDDYAKTRRPIKSRESLNRENESYKRQAPEGKTYLEDDRRADQRARQEARDRYYRENPQ